MRRKLKALLTLLVFTLILGVVAVIVVRNAGAESLPPVMRLRW